MRAAAASANSVALGSSANASAANTVALGANSTTTANLAAAGYNPGSTAVSGTASAAKGEVSVGSSGNERRVTNVAAGAAVTDAVNVSQLQSEAAKSNAMGTNAAAALGGGAAYNSTTGAISAPSYSVGGTTVRTVADAVTNLDGRTTQNTTNITSVSASVTNLTSQLNAGTVGLVRQTGTGPVTVALGNAGTIVDFTGTAGARTLGGVAAGSLAADSTEAVNGSQLFETNDRMTKAESNITTVKGDVTNLSTQINNGEVGLVRQDVTTGNISVASDMGGDTVDMGDTAGPRTLTGVANGTQNTDAVTIAQLKAVGLVDPNGQTLAALVYDNLSLGHATLGGTNGTVIGNLVDGRIAANSMDAVNGGQLFTLQTQYDQLNVRVGNLDGRVNNLADLTNPALSASGKNSTAAGLGADASGENSTALGTDSSATGSNSVALGHGSVADRDNSVSMGFVGNERQVTNVAAATAATDAVNLGQVNNLLAQGMAQTMQQANDYTDQRFDQAAHAINSVARNAYAGIAAAMAMPNMTPSGHGRTIVAAGAGNYKNGSAVAAGATYRSQNSKWLMNAAVSVTSTGDAGVRAQVGYEF